VLREPLVHFLLIGAMIFGVYSLTAAPEAEGPQTRIVIEGAEIEQLAAVWEQRWKRPPTENDLESLIEERVREEVFYREALALGLDRNDVQIRRLMRKKLEFITQDVLSPPEPTTAELTAYHSAHADRYSRPLLLSFTQIYFAADRRGGAAEKDARIVLARLNEGLDETAAMAAGDGQFLPYTVREQTTRDIEAMFGPEFAASVAGIDPGAWQGPVGSAYGQHLVRIDARRAGELLSFAEVADTVRADWIYEQSQKANDEMYRRLRDRYEVIVEPITPAQADDRDGGQS
jgi:hypothetical protein